MARGGRFRSARFLVDAGTLALGVTASLLPFLLSPVFSALAPTGALYASVGYTFGIAATGIMGALLYMQIMNWQEERAIAWFLVGVTLIVLGDLATAAANLRGRYMFGGCDVIVSACVYMCFTTAAYAQYRPAPARPTVAQPVNVHGFVPILSLFVAVAIVLGAEFNATSANVMLAAGLAFVAAALLVLRQFRVRLELERLTGELAERAAEARVSELVRRSCDVIAVVGGDGLLRYVSPACLKVLGCAPQALAGTPVELMFGSDHGAAVRDFLAGTSSAGRLRPAGELELRILVDGAERVVNVTASDESANRLIEGTVLTVRDLTAQRALESTLLDIATRERQRLCGDIHEGLGQQLTGIGLYLKSMNVARSRSPSAAPESLDPVIFLVNSAVDQVRTLARGLSPLEVVHRSLESALRALAADIERQFSIEMRLRADIDADVLGDLEADHLYRIVHEAVLNACRHGRGSVVDVELRVQAAQISLVVTDDGEGLADGALEKDHLGLRMMRYRVQLLGGTVRLEGIAGGGTRLSVHARRQRPGAAV